MSFFTNYNTFCDQLESPQIYIDTAARCLISSMMDKRVWLQMGRGFYFDTSIYTLLVGPAGSGKSTALDWGIDMILDNIPHRSSKMLGSSFTCRALKDKLSLLGEEQDGKTCAFLHPDEAKTFFGAYTGEEMVGFLTEIYNQKRDYSYETAHSGVVYFPKPYITFCGNCTIEFVEGVLKEDLLQEGFGRRCIFAYAGAKRKLVPFPEEKPEHLEAYDECVKWLRELEKLNGPFTVLEEARRWFEDWYMGIGSVDHGLLNNYYANKRVHLWKFAMLESLSERLDLTIRVKDLEGASRYLERVERGMERVFRSLGKNLDSALRFSILDYLALKTTATRTQIAKRFYSDASLSKIKEILKELTSIEEIEECVLGEEVSYKLVKD
jgi:hypothetical protein